MREIKFRVWDSEEMISLSEAFLKYIIGIQEDDKSNQLEVFYNHVKLMQYTGLKDKNGVEIYEGDIVFYKFASYQDISEVIYNKNYTKFEMVSLKEGDNTSACKFKKGRIHEINKTFIDGYDYVKVIGNIYENEDYLAN